MLNHAEILSVHRRKHLNFRFFALIGLLCCVLMIFYSCKTPSGNDFGPGVKYLSSCGDTLYFQPYYDRAKTSSVFCWDGKTLVETPAKDTDGIFAYSQGCYYTTNNVLYRYEKSTNQTTKIRDLNSDRRLGDVSTRKKFTVRIFYVDQNEIYAACYGDGENAQGYGESPFFLLRISTDGTKAEMIYADGKGETGTYLSGIIVSNQRIYYSNMSGIYSLAMNGKDKRLLTTSHPRDSYGCYIPPVLFDYNGGLAFIGQQPESNPTDSLFTIDHGNTKEICKVSSTTFFCLQGSKLYYSKDPADHNAMYGTINAYDLKTGKYESVMNNKQPNESYAGDCFYQALPENHGLFMVYEGGEVCYYNTETKKLIMIYGG